MSSHVDWDSQWEMHAHNFQHGFMHLDLTPWGFPTTIRLKPGPGFGDFSHPTTQLVLDMMHKHVAQSTVFDIGSGSGILSLAAIAMGAKHAIGIEIDPEAIQHAKENAILNQMNLQISFQNSHEAQPQEALPSNLSSPIIVMNMIRTEQIIAWNSFLSLQPMESSLTYPKWIDKEAKLFSSGILKEEEQEYIQQLEKWCWKAQDIKEQNGWLGFYAQRDA